MKKALRTDLFFAHDIVEATKDAYKETKYILSDKNWELISVKFVKNIAVPEEDDSNIKKREFEATYQESG